MQQQIFDSKEKIACQQHKVYIAQILTSTIGDVE